MIIDIKSIFIEQFTSMFEHVIWIVPVIFAVTLYAFVFRREVAYDLNLARREENRLGEKSLLIAIVILMATVAYLYIKEHFFLLSAILSVILTYFLYTFGVIDMIIAWWEDRHGR
jgi:hypothetical protein